MRKMIVVMALMLLSFVNISFSADAVDEFVSQHIKKKQIPGVALLVVKDGAVVRSKGYGMANLEHSVPVKPQTVFQSGSIGKQFTATAIMMLMEEGKVQLTDPISKYLEVPDSWKNITIRHLLTHTSGLGDYPEDFSLQKDYTEDEELEVIKKQPLGFAPGEGWAYSNLGYVTLGILIHKVTGQFYGDFLQARVFKPLGMISTRVISEADIVPNRAAGYSLVKGEIKNQTWVSPSVNTTADGSLYFTIEDLARWDAALRTEVLVKKSTLDQMWTPVVLKDGATQPYGFGWELSTTSAGHKVVEHGGAWQGFTTHIARYLDDHITVAVLSNLEGADSTYIAHAVAGFYNPQLAPPRHVARKIDPAVLKSYEGQYRYEDRLTVKISELQGRLITEFSGQHLELIPENDHLFFEEDSELTVEFEKDLSGKVTGMILRLPLELKLRKIE